MKGVGDMKYFKMIWEFLMAPVEITLPLSAWLCFVASFVMLAVGDFIR